MLSMERGTKLMLLVAPAGFGKSTTARALARDVPTAVLLDDGRVPREIEAALDALWEQQPHARAIVCSRRPLRVPFRHVLPHEVRVARASDLRVGRRALGQRCAPLGIGEDELDALYAQTLGWPAAVEAALECAREGRSTDLRAHGLFAEYIAGEVLPSLSDAARTLVLAAALGPLTNGDAETGLEEVDGAFLFAGRRGRYRLHPLLAACIAASHTAPAREAAATLAERAERAGRPLSAARWHLGAGDPARAVAAFKSLRFAHLAEISSEESDAAAQLHSEELLDDLGILNIALAERLYERDRERWFVLAEEALRRAPAAVDPHIRARVLLALAMRSCYFARFDDVRRVLAQERIHGESSEIYAVALRFCEAYLSTTQDAFVDLAGVRTALGVHLLNGFWRVPFASLASYTYGVLGDWAAARAEWEIMLESTERWGRRSQAAEALMGAAFFAWFYGDDERLDAWLRTIESLDAAEGTALFERSVRWRNDPLPAEARETMQARAYAYLIAAARAPRAEMRLSYARRGLAAALQTGRPFFVTLAHLALALLGSNDDTHAAHARACAQQVASLAFRGAVEAVLDGEPDAGMLDAFRGRYRASPSTAAELRINVLHGGVEWHGRSIVLQDRARDVLFALVLAQRPLRGDELATRVWPDREPAEMQNALRVHIAAIRKATGAGSIACENGNYRVPHAVIDVDELERLLRYTRGERVLAPQMREMLCRVIASPAVFARPHADAEWMAPVERRVQAMRRAVRIALADDAMLRGNAEDALSYANGLTHDDPCDERARSLAIRAHLLAGNRAEAHREYREYRRAVQEELGMDLARGDHAEGFEAFLTLAR